MLRKIKKAKLNYDTRYLDVDFDELDDDGNVDHNTRDSEGRRRKVHDDLVEVFKQISEHFVVLCEQFQKHEVEDLHVRDKFVLRGFVIGGSEDQEGVTLFGCRKLEHNMVLNMVAPFTKFHPDHTKYRDANTLAELIQQAFREIDMYLSHDKFAPESQQELFDDYKPKKRKRKNGKALPQHEQDLLEEQGAWAREAGVQ